MKTATIKIATADKSFSGDQLQIIRRITQVLIQHQLAVCTIIGRIHHINKHLKAA
jgi:hypothetical protein